MGHSKVEKTNAARLLDRAKIAYELVPYAVDEEHLAATHVAEQLGEDIACVFKTLVLKGDRTGYFVCVVPGDHEVDLKAAARVSGNKKVDLIPVKELLPVTGYIRGGCSPVGMKKAFPTYIHSTALDHPFIYISAGVRGAPAQGRPGGAHRLRPCDRGRTEPSGIAHLTRCLSSRKTQALHEHTGCNPLAANEKEHPLPSCAGVRRMRLFTGHPLRRAPSRAALWLHALRAESVNGVCKSGIGLGALCARRCIFVS